MIGNGLEDVSYLSILNNKNQNQEGNFSLGNCENNMNYSLSNNNEVNNTNQVIDHQIESKSRSPSPMFYDRNKVFDEQPSAKFGNQLSSNNLNSVIPFELIGDKNQ